MARKANRVYLLDPAKSIGVLYGRWDRPGASGQRHLWANYQLGELEQALGPRGFFRARRSALVKVKRVKEIRSGQRSPIVLVMSDEKSTEVEVSERQGRALRTCFPGL